MLVGEQPGDQEDRAGLPFVGPAGQLLDDALDAAGIDRTAVYVTNAVKHFKWKARGKRRIHDKPNKSEIDACSIWLELELSHITARHPDPPWSNSRPGPPRAGISGSRNNMESCRTARSPQPRSQRSTPPRSFASAAKIGKSHTPRLSATCDSQTNGDTDREAVRRNA